MLLGAEGSGPRGRFTLIAMERKLATVLFVDLVDSTALVTGADPEVVRRRVQTFFERVSHCVITHGGIVEKFAGDAVMAAFGIPQSHEDDAERAVRAGLAIMDAVDELELEARAGIESGEVVADDSDSTFATGEAVTLAARLLSTYAGTWRDDGIREAAPADIPALGEIAARSYTDSRFYQDGRFPAFLCDEMYRAWIEKSCQGSPCQLAS